VRAQGPYVYALYEHYKFSKQEIGVLFIAGFGSSAVFGTLTGELADRYGRRLACLVPTPSNVYNYTYTTTYAIRIQLCIHLYLYNCMYHTCNYVRNDTLAC